MAALILDHIYNNESRYRDQVLLTQPTGGSEVVDITWGQAMDQARRMATHLRSLGLEGGARIALLAKNSAHFVIAELAIWMAGGTTVAIFPTETAANIRFVLQHSGASLLFIGKLDTWAQQAEGVPAGLPCITLPLSPAALTAPHPGWDQIVARSEPLAGRPPRLGADLAMLLYTSGSTGQPKGVMHSFERITRTTELRNAETETWLPAGCERRMLSYLPLAHAYERAALAVAALQDGRWRIFFTESLVTFAADLRRARPTIFLSVPRLWLKFQQAVFASMPPAQLDALLDNPATAAAVGKKVLAGLGLDGVVVAASASAPIPPALMQWYRRLGLNMLEGYGMTEDFAYSHCTNADKNEAGHVGVAVAGVQVRIADDGEVLVKSPGQLVGYYQRPDLDAESFTADGFFRTGDRGELRDDGQLRITGRVKELFKTAKGEYVAPAPIENQLNAHPLVELSMVSGVGQPSAYAVLVLDEHLRPKLQDPDQGAALRKTVQAQLSQLLQEVNATLVGHERLQMLVVAPEPWSIENGCLTPTMKIKRSRIEGLVAPALDHWYGAAGPVVWA